MFLFAGGSLHAQKQGECIPSSPGALLSVLPEALPRWEVTRSEGRSYVGRGFFSQAKREFTEILPPEVAEKTKTPLKVVVEIRDTAENENQLRPFRMTPEQLLAAGLKRGEWKGNPMILLSDGDAEREAIRILLRDRWILQLVYPNRDLNAARRWLDGVDLAKVRALNFRRYTKDQDAAPIQIIDELKPELSRRYLVSVTRGADVERLTQKIQAEYEEMGWSFETEEPETPDEPPHPDSS